MSFAPIANRQSARETSARLGLSFKIARTYEKLRRFDEAAETYYTHVVLAYWNGVRPDAGDDAARRVWFDGTARAFFARAAFSLADYYEARGESATVASSARAASYASWSRPAPYRQSADRKPISSRRSGRSSATAAKSAFASRKR